MVFDRVFVSCVFHLQMIQLPIQNVLYRQRCFVVLIVALKTNLMRGLQLAAELGPQWHRVGQNAAVSGEICSCDSIVNSRKSLNRQASETLLFSYHHRATEEELALCLYLH